MPLADRDWIAARIPHRGTMCLLDTARSADAQHALCTASSHRSADNPLRVNGRLGVICAIEYAAQAIAVHNALLEATAQPGVTPAQPAAGYLASARAVEFFVKYLDDIATDLDIEVVRLSGDGNSVLYRFELRAYDKVLASGRVTVVLDATALIVPAAKLTTEKSQ
ncbi:MAG: putative 3-oxoacyl-[acyl-carrier-protein] reductase FabG [Verrucomicrobiaceae bacterium]|nr:putative 3-oxoacyl-[acyl-carrier-protein] reductase FabG [Verrucomicrobiaceae bacterium]